MKRTFPVGIGVALFVAGVLVAQLAPSNSNAQGPAKPKESAALALTESTSETMAYLKALQEGNIEQAKALMETHLDLHVVKLGESLAALPASERSPQSLNVIREFRDYRAKHPHPVHTDYLAKGIDNAYKLLDSAK